MTLLQCLIAETCTASVEHTELLLQVGASLFNIQQRLAPSSHLCDILITVLTDCVNVIVGKRFCIAI